MSIALRDDAHRDMSITAPGGGADPTGGRLVAWAEGLAAAHRIGSALCQTAFVPVHFRGKPDETAAAILFGDEIGFSPTQAVQNIHVISGKPGMYARSMVALVQSKGHDVWTEEATATKVIVCGRRRGSQHVERSEWTIEKARKAGYTSNKKYEQAPEDMLYARAASTVCRRIAADALAGIAYSVEELELDEPQPTRSVTRGRTGAAKVQRQPKPEVPEPDLDEPQPEVSDPAPDRITDAQRAAIFAAFRDAGWTSDARSEEGRTQRLEYMAQILDGEVVESTNDLTQAQASRVLDALRQDAQDAPAGEDLPIEVQE